MKFYNFKTHEDKRGITAAQLDLAALYELSLNEFNEEAYLCMINPRFDFGYKKDGVEVIGSYVVAVFPQRDSNQNKEYQAWSMYGPEAYPSGQYNRGAGDLGNSITFANRLCADSDLNNVLKELDVCYGAKNKEELNARLSAYHKGLKQAGSEKPKSL